MPTNPRFDYHHCLGREWYRQMRVTTALCLVLIWLCSLNQALAQMPRRDRDKQPNIVFILTDDQDLHMDSLSYMPFLQKHITDQGTTFSRHYCTVALCCPSRVSIWTGKAAHNTNVTDINPPYGGYPKFISQGFKDKYLPVWLQDAGYNTFYVGKLFNAQSTSNYDSPHAAGWTGSEFLLDPYTYEYYNSTFQRNHDAPVSYEGKYSTDVAADKTLAFLDDALAEDKPFFLTVAPVAPHSNVHINIDLSNGGGNYSGATAVQSPPQPAERHKHLFNDTIVPRTPNFNPDKASGASWILTLPRQNRTNVEYNDDWYRNRLRAMQAVDEMIDGIVHRLDEAGILEETYLFFSTDNGYAIGQHRRQPGKQCAFEEDINVPFIVRGPGIPKGHTTNIVTSHTDVAPTFLELAGVTEFERERYELDGSPIPLRPHPPELMQHSWQQEHVNVEMWGIIMSEGKYGFILYPNHTYKALRVIGEGYNLLYTEWCTNEHELYNLIDDPWQMDNIYDASGTSSFSINAPADTRAPHHSGFAPSSTDPSEYSSSDTNITTTIAHLISRLDALLLLLKTCKTEQCRFPWRVIHPALNVCNLRDALDPRYDHFYHTRPKVRYDRCEKGYIPESEGVVWDDSLSFGVMQHEVWLGV